MKKLINYIKTSKLPAKILIGVWMFFIFVVTLGFSVSSEDSTNSSAGEDFLLLLMVYLVTSVMFFISISTINKISQKISVDKKTHQLVLRYLVKEFLKVNIHYPYISVIQIFKQF